MCQQENEGHTICICTMCGAQKTEELADGNTECLSCGFIFNPKNPGVTRVGVAWEIEWMLPWRLGGSWA